MKPSHSVSGGLTLGSDVVIGALGFTILTAAAVWVHEVTKWAASRDLAQWIKVALSLAEAVVFLVDIVGFLVFLVFSLWKFLKPMKDQI